MSIGYFTVADTYGNLVQDQVRWGTPYHQPNQSGLGFTGNVGGSITENTAFEIGQLTHFNYEIGAGTNATAVDLKVTLTFSSPAGGGTSTFNFLINETPGLGVPDIITFPAGIPSETISLGGNDYVLKLLGFGDTPATLQSDFVSPETGAPNSTLLWGRISEAAIPAPGAILLCGIGSVVVGRIRRRRIL